MRRVTITIPDDLYAALTSYLESQETAPSLDELIGTVLWEYLQERELEARQHRNSPGALRITPAFPGSGLHDVSVEHDRYSGEEE
jgi:metal-responsive CopG/Arc/MetJ family transcriptional regulator